MEVLKEGGMNKLCSSHWECKSVNKKLCAEEGEEEERTTGQYIFTANPTVFSCGQKLRL